MVLMLNYVVLEHFANLSIFIFEADSEPEITAQG